MIKTNSSWLTAGYLIPKGWKVLPLFRNIHHSPDHFPCPEKFDPSRFEVSFLSRSQSFFHSCYLPLLPLVHQVILQSGWLSWFAGGSQAQHVHAFRERDSLVPRQRARQAGDARPLPPPRHQVQVVHVHVRERRAVRPLRAADQRPAHDLHAQRLNDEEPLQNGWMAVLVSSVLYECACKRNGVMERGMKPLPELAARGRHRTGRDVAWRGIIHRLIKITQSPSDPCTDSSSSAGRTAGRQD
jgi:hypothetical protein